MLCADVAKFFVLGVGCVVFLCGGVVCVVFCHCWGCFVFPFWFICYDFCMLVLCADVALFFVLGVVANASRTSGEASVLFFCMLGGGGVIQQKTGDHPLLTI